MEIRRENVTFVKFIEKCKRFFFYLFANYKKSEIVIICRKIQKYKTIRFICKIYEKCEKSRVGQFYLGKYIVKICRL